MIVALLRRLTLVRSELSLRFVEAFMPHRSLAVVDQHHLLPREGGGEEEEDLFSSSTWLFAAPKKKVSKMRKRRKLAGWALKPITHLYDCHFCGKPRMRHKLSKCCIEHGIEATRLEKELAASKIMAGQQMESIEQQKPRSLN